MTIVFEACCHDGQVLEKGAVMARMSGDAAQLLQGERVALNLLQRMSGIAPLRPAYVQCSVKVPKARIVDTRKTTPDCGCLKNMLYGLVVVSIIVPVFMMAF
jgi:nicotinate-nucleotide pyrophosphorylase (carboxylating)